MKSELWITPLATAMVLTLLSCQSGYNPSSLENGKNPEVREEPEVLFTLYQNSPNPFQNTTLIRFRLEKTLSVHLKIGGITVLNEVREGPAVHYVVFQAPENFPNGEYEYTLAASGRYQVKAMRILR